MVLRRNLSKDGKPLGFVIRDRYVNILKGYNETERHDIRQSVEPTALNNFMRSWLCFLCSFRDDGFDDVIVSVTAPLIGGTIVSIFSLVRSVCVHRSRNVCNGWNNDSK